jgi:hypothetical protein
MNKKILKQYQYLKLMLYRLIYFVIRLKISFIRTNLYYLIFMLNKMKLQKTLDYF